MARTRIYGASDDLIEVEGEFNDEIGCYFECAGNGVPVRCSDGTKVLITYDGDWTIDIQQEGTKFIKVVNGNDEIPHTDEDAIDCTSYSDVLVMESGLEWIKIGNKKIFP